MAGTFLRVQAGNVVWTHDRAAVTAAAAAADDA